MTDLQRLAKIILHDLEIELSTKIGILENDLNLVDLVAASLDSTSFLDELEGKISEEVNEDKCNCKCRICQMADHEDEA